MRSIAPSLSIATMLLCLSGCAAMSDDESRSVAYLRGKYYGAMYGGLRSDAFTAPAGKLTNEEVSSRCLKITSRSLSTGIGDHDLLAWMKWNEKFGKEFLDGFDPAYKTALAKKDVVEDVAFAIGWLNADTEFKNGSERRLGPWGNELMRECFVAIRPLVGGVKTVDDEKLMNDEATLRKRFYEAYDLGYEARLKRSEPVGRWMEREVSALSKK